MDQKFMVGALVLIALGTFAVLVTGVGSSTAVSNPGNI